MIHRSPLPARAWLVVWLAGASLFLLRLLIGLGGVHACRRRSKHVHDPAVLALVDALRLAAGHGRSIELRELPKPATASAAAVGWLRPMVLLPADWRTWNQLELRAVLAHEIAHIARADYAAGLVARLSVAIHFYHPLIHWIAGRLQLQQELAADALAAELAGGRQDYLIALTRLALRTQSHRLAWPARTFLPARGQLIRRIHVLKQKAACNAGPLPTRWRVITVVLLATVGLGAAAVCRPTLSHAKAVAAPNPSEPPDPRADATRTAHPAAFAVEYLPANSEAVFAVRPAAMFAIPGMKPRAQTFLGYLRDQFARTLPEIESIEQACVELSVLVLPGDRSQKQHGRIMTGDFMVRSVHDFDWKPACKQFVKLFGAQDVELLEVQFQGKTYYKTGKHKGLGDGACLYLPDARTVFFTQHEDRVRGVIERGATVRPPVVTGDDWRKVEHGLFAYALDTERKKGMLDVATEDPGDLLVAPLLRHARRWVVGVDYVERLTFRATGSFGSVSAREAAAKVAETVLTKARARELGGESPPPTQAFWHVFKELLDVCAIRQAGATLDLIAERKLSNAELAALLAELNFF